MFSGWVLFNIIAQSCLMSFEASFYEFGCLIIDPINLNFPLFVLHPNKFIKSCFPYFFKWPYLSSQMRYELNCPWKAGFKHYHLNILNIFISHCNSFKSDNKVQQMGVAIWYFYVGTIFGELIAFWSFKFKFMYTLCSELIW